MSNDIAYVVLLKRKNELENELEAIKIAMSCFDNQQANSQLTDDERIILENIGEDCISLMRVNGSIYFHTEGKGIFPNLFQFIKEGEEYEIKELLKR